MSGRPSFWTTPRRAAAQAILDAGQPDSALTHIASRKQVINALHRGILRRPPHKRGFPEGSRKSVAPEAEQAHISR